MLYVFNTPGATTFTCPGTGPVAATLRIWSGGGAGGDDDGTHAGGGGGGAAMNPVKTYLTGGMVYDVYVGAGGVFGVTPPGNYTGPGSGGPSYFGCPSAPLGCSFAIGVNSSFQQPGYKGDGSAGIGTGHSSAPGATGGSFDGGNGYFAVSVSGGGGGSASGRSAAGIDAPGTTGGTAPTGGGNGGSSGANGSNPGGGGGGANVGGSPGNGGNGRVEVEIVTGVLTAGSGSFTINGTAVTFRYWHMGVNSGSFLLSGKTANLKQGHRLVAGSGSFIFTGSSTVRRADAGSFYLTGPDVAFPRTYARGNYSPGFPLPPIRTGQPPKFPGVILR